jgi:hypothetical protein
MLILRDGAWIGLRNSLAFAAATAALIFFLTTWRGREANRDAWPAPSTSSDAPQF